VPGITNALIPVLDNAYLSIVTNLLPFSTSLGRLIAVTCVKFLSASSLKIVSFVTLIVASDTGTR
jgi:hypothetical protein